jgi:hypothetical protein
MSHKRLAIKMTATVPLAGLPKARYNDKPDRQNHTFMIPPAGGGTRLKRSAWPHRCFQGILTALQGATGLLQCKMPKAAALDNGRRPEGILHES